MWRIIEAGTHDVFLGEVVDVGFNEGADDVTIAAIGDTRMKYGGVKRH